MTYAALTVDPNSRQYKYLDLLINIFVVVLIVSNLVAQKFTEFGPFKISAAQLLFPITYIFGDVFTEVYGYAASRRAIWSGFMGAAVMTGMGLFAIWLPAAPEFKTQPAFEAIFGAVPRIVAGSLLAYWAGEFANSYVLARMKILTQGRMLWTRTIGSTIIGEGADSLIFYPLAFLGLPDWPAYDATTRATMALNVESKVVSDQEGAVRKIHIS